MAAPPEDIDVQALFARLKEEVRKAGSTAVANGAGHRGRRLAARAQAERTWPVSADRRVVGRPGPRGAIARPVKLALRRLMRWYVEPFAADQRAFNDAALKLVDELSQEVDRLHDEV